MSRVVYSSHKGLRVVYAVVWEQFRSCLLTSTIRDSPRVRKQYTCTVCYSMHGSLWFSCSQVCCLPSFNHMWVTCNNSFYNLEYQVIFCSSRMVMSEYIKLRVLSLHWQGYKVSFIAEPLVLEDGIKLSKEGIHWFLKRFAERNTTAWKPGSGCPLKLSPQVQELIKEALHNDDETTATQLQAMLASHRIYVSLCTIVCNRSQLGWIYRGSAYCQLIRDVNKQKRLEFATTYLHDTFNDVIWSDETTVQLETHQRWCYRKEGERPHLKPCLLNSALLMLLCSVIF